MDLRYVADSSLEGVEIPTVNFELLDLDEKGHLGPAIVANLELQECQSVTFILRTPPKKAAVRPVVATTKDAEALGVPLQVLIEGASKLRPRDDPILTTVRYLLYWHPENISLTTAPDTRTWPFQCWLSHPRGVYYIILTLLQDTNEYWQRWISRSTYEGRWREAVHRSALALKLLIFEPTGMPLF